MMSRFDMLGISIATNTVTVNGQSAYRKGEYFRKELPINNSTALSTNITVAATGQSSVTGSMLVAKALEAFWHDLDGNLLSDSLWTNRWNAENRLVQVESTTAIVANRRMREVWTHLPDGRWIERIVSTNNGSAYYPAFTNRFVWDGQVLLAVLNHTNGLVMSFVRGLDLSGSIQGAGGVGGVLAVNFAPSTLNPQPSTHFVSYDGNGNVVALCDSTNGTSSGQFEYGPFSEPIRVTGTAAQMMPLRFSTMYEDSVTGDRKYLFRDLNPSTGRWKSRDLIGEDGGIALYGFIGNETQFQIDVSGLSALSTVRRNLTEAGLRTAGSEMALTTHFGDALAKFSSLVPRIKATYGTPGKGKAALWDPNKDTLTIQDDSIGASSIVHEMTHAYQDLVLGYPFDSGSERLDEGEAYGMEGLFAVTRRLRIDQYKLHKAGCNPGAVANVWQSFWQHYGVLPGEWPTVGAAKGGGTMEKQDLARVYRILHVRLSCAAVAEVVNRMLAESHCCFMVTCSGTGSELEISPGIQIDPIFQ